MWKSAVSLSSCSVTLSNSGERGSVAKARAKIALEKGASRTRLGFEKAVAEQHTIIMYSIHVGM